MTHQAQRRISHRRAAELLYRTSKPSPTQIDRVVELIATGELVGDTRGTSATSVAEFASRAALERQDAANQDSCERRPQRDSQRAREVYQESLQQYFLAVFLRRKMGSASRRFRQAVLVGQIGVLCLVALVCLGAMRTMFPPLLPERGATVDWLKQNANEYRIIKFHPTTYDDDGNARVLLEYHYKTPTGRGVDTRRIFTVSDGAVIAVDSEE